MEELVIVTQTMVGEDLCEKEAQSLKEYVEEVVKFAPQKPKKKKTGKDEVGLNKAKDHERTFSPIKQKKGEDEMSMGSLAKTLVALKKYKGKENFSKPIVESNEHVNLHSFKSSGDVNSLILLLNGPKRGKGGKQALECLQVDELPESRKRKFQRWRNHPRHFWLLGGFHVFVVQQAEATTQN
jgi:glycerophosphoryl diester phosphodiesterase